MWENAQQNYSFSLEHGRENCKNQPVIVWVRHVPWRLGSQLLGLWWGDWLMRILSQFINWWVHNWTNYWEVAETMEDDLTSGNGIQDLGLRDDLIEPFLPQAVSIWTLGQSVVLFTEVQEVWPCWRKHATRGVLLALPISTLLLLPVSPWRYDPIHQPPAIPFCNDGLLSFWNHRPPKFLKVALVIVFSQRSRKVNEYSL